MVPDDAHDWVILAIAALEVLTVLGYVLHHYAFDKCYKGCYWNSWKFDRLSHNTFRYIKTIVLTLNITITLDTNREFVRAFSKVACVTLVN